MSIKLWDTFSAQLINQHLGHEAIVYCSQWSPFMSGTFATTSGDSTLRVWSVRDFEPTLTLRASFGK
jgi:WD40 repeat protein